MKYKYIARGTVGGNLWMSGCGEKEFMIVFTRDGSKPFSTQFNSIQDIKNIITNDGGFRSCEIVEGELEVIGSYDNRTITRYLDISY